MKHFMRRLGLAVAVLGLVAGAAGHARASLIVGGSTLVDSAGLANLEGWLGEGELTLTNIFTHTTGDGKTSYDFHAAADGKGRTFSVLELLDTNGNGHQIIGGYNPQSWSSSGGWNMTYADADRTAFLFNLTNVGIQRQTLFSDLGRYQTYNDGFYGPAFGGGHDLWVSTSLSYGYGANFSYGNSPIGTNNIVGKPYEGYSFDYGTMEVFTISGFTATATPEPSTMLVASVVSLMGLGYAWRRRNKAKLAA